SVAGKAEMRKSHASSQSGRAEAFTFSQRGEYVLVRHAGARRGQELAQYLQAVLLAARADVAQDILGFQDSFEDHDELLLSCPCSKRRTAAVRRVLPYGPAAGGEVPANRTAKALLECALVGFPRVMIGKFFLVLPDLPVKLVHEAVDGCVHVVFSGVCVYLAPIDVDGGFSLVPQFLHRQDTMYIGYQVKMPSDLFDFTLDIVPESGRDIDVMARET